MKEVKLVENTSEIGAGTRGASLGIGALKVVARSAGSNFFGNYERFCVTDCNDLLDQATNYPYAKYIDGLAEVFQDTTDILERIYQGKDFPFVLSGDHSCAAGTIAGIKKSFPDKRLGVVWIDAHADLHSPFTTPSGNVHGMPLAIVTDENNMDCAINEPNEEAAEMFDKLKSIGFKGQKVKTEDLVFIGVRDTEEPEDYLMKQKNIKNYTVDEVRTKGTRTVFQEIQEKLSACDLVYISFDVDSMDCDIVSRGTGTPVKNGLTPEEATDFMHAFSDWEKTCCVECVEINPCLDNKINKMAETAFEILESCAAKIEQRL